MKNCLPDCRTTFSPPMMACDFPWEVYLRFDISSGLEQINSDNAWIHLYGGK